MDDPRVGTDLAGYRILGVIGRGGASVVYLAEHLRLGRRVALKVLAPHLALDESFRKRFLSEWRVAGRLEHPNIVPVYDADEADGVLYLAMRYVEGGDLGKVLRSEGALDPWRTISITSQVADALDAAHAEGLVHRDVKPANVLLERHGAGRMEGAFLSDFGLTKRIESTGGGLTRSGQFVGTIDYVAPEQILGERIDGRTDVYSLGCLVFHCMTGKPPFPRPNDVGTIYAHVHEPPPPLVPGKSSAMDGVIGRALAKDRDGRYGTCSGLVEAVRSALQVDPDTLSEAAVAPEAPIDEAETAPEEPATVVVPRAVTEVAPRPAPERERSRKGIAWVGAAAALAVAIAVVANVLAAPTDPVDRSGAPTTTPPSSPPPGEASRRQGPLFSWLYLGDWQPDGGFGNPDENEVLIAATPTEGGLLAVGHADLPNDEDPAVWRTRNGREWTRVDADALRMPGFQRLVDVTAFGDGYVAIGYSGDDAAIWATDRGERGWHLVDTLPESGFQVMRKIIAVDDSLRVVGWNEVGEEVDAASWVSEDGTTWTRIPDDALEGPGVQEMWTVIEVEGVVFGLGSAGQPGSTDPAVWRLDGDAWSPVETGLASPGEQEIRDVAIGDDGTVVAVGIDGTDAGADVGIWSSDDPGLRSWRPATGGFRVENEQQLLAVVATDLGFVAMGWTAVDGAKHDGLVWSSSDGARWTTPKADSVHVVQFGGPKMQEVRALVEFELQDELQLVALGTRGNLDENGEVWIGTPIES